MIDQQFVLFALSPEEHKLILAHRRHVAKVAYDNQIIEIAKRIDPNAWEAPWREEDNELDARRNASFSAAEKEFNLSRSSCLNFSLPLSW
jgi:UDP-N-acetylglucosamine transferase subunit ALG13